MPAPVDSAMRMASYLETPWGPTICRGCGAPVGPFGVFHPMDCLVKLAMPGIVAALEAAERVALAWERRESGLTGEGLSPAASLGSYGAMHREVRALVAVLRGEG